MNYIIAFIIATVIFTILFLIIDVLISVAIKLDVLDVDEWVDRKSDMIADKIKRRRRP